MFQIVLSELDRHGNVVARWPVHPLYELQEDAVAIAEFDALRLTDDGKLNEAGNCIHATDRRGRTFCIEVKEVASVDVAAYNENAFNRRFTAIERS